MKPKKPTKKLVFSKQTILNFNSEQQKKIKAGLEMTEPASQCCTALTYCEINSHCTENPRWCTHDWMCPE